MRIEATPRQNSAYPTKYWIDMEENTLTVGKNNDDGYTFVLAQESMDWFVAYLRNKSALMVPQIVQTILHSQFDWATIKGELIRL